MASMDDYDEFGNYIGADLDSDDDEGVGQVPVAFGQPSGSTAAPLEGYDEDITMQSADEGALMQIDGACTSSRPNSHLVDKFLSRTCSQRCHPA